MARSAASFFSLFSELAGLWWWWPLVYMPVAALLLIKFMHMVGPGTEGSGIQQVVAAVQAAEKPALVSCFINLRLTAAKFSALVFSLGSGFVAGLEGPTVQLGAGLMYSLRRFLPFEDAAGRRLLLLAGGAAGMAAAFSAPLAALMFAFEELLGEASPPDSARLGAAVLLAAVIAFAFSGPSYFGLVLMPLGGFNLKLLLILALVTVTGALVGGSFSWLVVRAGRWLPAAVIRFRDERPYCFAALCALAVAVLGLGAPIFGSGADLTRLMLHQEAQVTWYYLPLKFAALIITCLSRIPGGVFSPCLSLGAGVASWFLVLAGPEWHGEIMAIGLVAALSAATRAPLTAALIIMEMTTAGHTFILAALASAIVAANLSASLFQVRFYHELALGSFNRLPPQLKELSGR
jgi:H+/Cl- antiporter ClcA